MVRFKDTLLAKKEMNRFSNTHLQSIIQSVSTAQSLPAPISHAYVLPPWNKQSLWTVITFLSHTTLADNKTK